MSDVTQMRLRNLTSAAARGLAAAALAVADIFYLIDYLFAGGPAPK